MDNVTIPYNHFILENFTVSKRIILSTQPLLYLLGLKNSIQQLYDFTREAISLKHFSDHSEKLIYYIENILRYNRKWNYLTLSVIFIYTTFHYLSFSFPVILDMCLASYLRNVYISIIYEEIISVCIIYGWKFILHVIGC